MRADPIWYQVAGNWVYGVPTTEHSAHAGDVDGAAG